MKRILLHLDTDPRPSVFDRIVALDAGADEVLSYGGVTPENCVPLAHGAIFTRGPNDLKHTAIFVGGSDEKAAGKVAAAVSDAFFGPLRVSVMTDPNGANTTAAAAVRKVRAFEGRAAVLGAGAVGSRVARLLRDRGHEVRVFDPSTARGGNAGSVAAAVDGAAAAFACGPAGTAVTKVPALAAAGVKIAVDLNAVPPAGVEGIERHDDGADRGGVRCFGPLAVGGLKMSIHKAAIRALFAANDRAIGAVEALELAADPSDA